MAPYIRCLDAKCVASEKILYRRHRRNCILLPIIIACCEPCATVRPPPTRICLTLADWLILIAARPSSNAGHQLGLGELCWAAASRSHQARRVEFPLVGGALGRKVNTTSQYILQTVFYSVIITTNEKSCVKLLMRAGK